MLLRDAALQCPKCLLERDEEFVSLEPFQNKMKSSCSTPAENVVNFLLLLTNAKNSLVRSSVYGSSVNFIFIISEVHSVSTRYPNSMDMCFDIDRFSRQTKSR